MRANQRFAFIAQPTRLCDFSSAGEPETALIFLNRLRVDGLDKAFLQVHSEFPAAKARHLAGMPLYLIAHAGNGSMTLDEDHPGQYVSWEQFVRLPRGIPTVSEPGLGLLVRLQNLESMVLRFVHAEKRKTVNARNPEGASASF
jgi:hypothetical protein